MKKTFVPVAMRSMLIEDDGKLILIDNGIGDKQNEKFLRHYYLHGDNTLDKSLAKHGFHREDITDVFLTHLHFDHCGGSIVKEGDKLVPAFTNAIYWSNEMHWQWATKPNEREEASFLHDNILPIQESGQLQFIQNPQEAFTNKLLSKVFTEDISVRFVSGHTHSMMLAQINSNEKIIVYMADLYPLLAYSIALCNGYDMSLNYFS